jgi:hypothetical protein
MKTYVIPVDEPGQVDERHFAVLKELATKDANLTGKLLAYWMLGKPRYELSQGETRRLVVHLRNFVH